VQTCRNTNHSIVETADGLGLGLRQQREATLQILRRRLQYLLEFLHALIPFSVHAEIM